MYAWIAHAFVVVVVVVVVAAAAAVEYMYNAACACVLRPPCSVPAQQSCIRYSRWFGCVSLSPPQPPLLCLAGATLLGINVLTKHTLVVLYYLIVVSCFNICLGMPNFCTLVALQYLIPR